MMLVIVNHATLEDGGERATSAVNAGAKADMQP
jgi:hypothetical protein